MFEKRALSEIICSSLKCLRISWTLRSVLKHRKVPNEVLPTPRNAAEAGMFDSRSGLKRAGNGSSGNDYKTAQLHTNHLFNPLSRRLPPCDPL